MLVSSCVVACPTRSVLVVHIQILRGPQTAGLSGSCIQTVSIRLAPDPQAPRTCDLALWWLALRSLVLLTSRSNWKFLHGPHTHAQNKEWPVKKIETVFVKKICQTAVLSYKLWSNILTKHLITCDQSLLSLSPSIFFHFGSSLHLASSPSLIIATCT